MDTLGTRTGLAHTGTPLPLTIVVNTYRREACLRRVVTHYHTCRVTQIRVVWNQPKHELPEWLQNVTKLYARSKRIVADINDENRLTNRFRPRPFPTEAVFSVDDDLMWSCRIIRAAFRVWQAEPDRMVGFSARYIDPLDPMSEARLPPRSRASGGLMLNTQLKYWCSSYWPMGIANIVLATKGGILRGSWYSAYFSDELASLREMIDANRTAEDVLMAMVHVRATGTPPVLLTTRSVDWLQKLDCGPRSASLTNDDTKHTRGTAIASLQQYFSFPLMNTSTFVDPIEGHIVEAGMLSTPHATPGMYKWP